MANDTIPRHAIKLSENPGDEVLITEAEGLAISAWLRGKDKIPGAPTGPRTVHQRIVQAMRAVRAVGKDGFNEQQRYPFRGIDGVINALGPALREAGVYITSDVMDIRYRDARTTQDKPTREVTVKVAYTFHGEDGDSVTTVAVGESLDQSDKGTAKAMSVAMRVALLQVFALPTQEPTTDHDGHYHQRGGQPQMSKFERDTGRNMLAAPTLEARAAVGPEMTAAAFRQALAFRTCIEEHSAWEQPSNGEESPTWEELFTARVAAEIAAVATPEAGRALYGLLKAEGLDMAYNGVKFSQLLKERAAEMQAAQAQLVNELTESILAASLDTLQDAWAAAYDARKAGRITEDQLTELHKLTNDRQAKLEREQNQTAAEAEVKSWDTGATS